MNTVQKVLQGQNKFLPWSYACVEGRYLQALLRACCSDFVGGKMLCPNISRRSEPRGAKSEAGLEISLLFFSGYLHVGPISKICPVYNDVMYNCLFQDGQSVEEGNLQLQVYRGTKVTGLWRAHFTSVLVWDCGQRKIPACNRDCQQLQGLLCPICSWKSCNSTSMQGKAAVALPPALA